MNEKIKEILGVNDNVFNESTSTENVCDKNTKKEVKAEATLQLIATIVLWCGIFLTIIFCFTIIFIKDSTTNRSIYIFNPNGLGVTIGTLLYSILCWSAMKVFANISITLKEINKKLK